MIRLKIKKQRSKTHIKFQKFLIFGLYFLFLIFDLWFLQGCSSSSRTTWEYMPDMADQPSLKAQRYAPDLPHHRGMLEPVAGTIPRGYEPYPYKEDPEAAGKNLLNPLPRTQAVLEAGQKTFNTYCIVCHGTKGLGDGSVVPKFPKPPSLQSEKVRDWSDGRIYHVITMGQNLMPSYASQLTSQQRWAVIHYVRALQKAGNPKPEDVEEYQRARKEKNQK